MPAPKRLMQVVEAFAVHDGYGVYNVGEIYDADDPLVKRYSQFFKPVSPTRSAPVEQMTAAPGEKRGAA